MSSAVTYGEIHRQVLPDMDYSENAVGVLATTVIWIPVGDDKIAQEITSPGLWGIETLGTTDDEPYLASVFDGERETLLAMLSALGAKPRYTGRPAFGSDPSGFTRV